MLLLFSLNLRAILGRLGSFLTLIIILLGFFSGLTAFLFFVCLFFGGSCLLSLFLIFADLVLLFLFLLLVFGLLLGFFFFLLGRICLDFLELGVEVLFGVIDCGGKLFNMGFGLTKNLLQLELLLTLSTREQVLDVTHVLLVGLEGSFGNRQVILELLDGLSDRGRFGQVLSETNKVEVHRWLDGHGLRVDKADLGCVLPHAADLVFVFVQVKHRVLVVFRFGIKLIIILDEGSELVLGTELHSLGRL